MEEKEHIHTNLRRNEYKKDELGQPVGIICLTDKMCLMVCSFCESVKEFNDVLSFVNHIKSVHIPTVNSKIVNTSAIDIKDEFIDNLTEFQNTSWNSGTDTNLIKQEDYFDEALWKIIENETKNTMSEHYGQKTTTHLADQNVFVKCGKNIDNIFNAVDIHLRQFYCTNCKSNFKFENELLKHICTYDATNPEEIRKNQQKLYKYNSEDFEEQFTTNDDQLLHLSKQQKTNKIESNGFNCKQCDLDFQSENEMRQHICLKKKTFQCTKCDRTFSYKYYIKIHMRIHNGEKPYKCDYENCNRSYTRMSSLDYHRRNHVCKKTESFQCATCNQSFTSKSYLKIHIRIHNGEKYNCEFENCNKSFTQKKSLVYHIRSHTGEKPYKCELCPLTFRGKWSLRHHMAKHTGKRFKCKFENCNRTFLYKSSLNAHIGNHFKKTSNSKSERKQLVEKRKMANHMEKRFKCEYENCNRSYHQKNSLVRHIRSHTEEKPHKCELCSLTFDRKDLLKNHNTTKHRYKCEYENCNRSYTHKNTLLFHIRGHTGEKPYKCELCPLAFRGKGSLRKHMAKHPGERFKCKYENCNRTFLNKSLLNVHIRSHFNKCSFKCDYEDCNRENLCKPSFHSHKRTYIGKKSFNCKFCPLAFHRKDSLTAHMVKHTNESFKCKFKECYESFVTLTDLQNHQQICQRQKIIQCPQCDKTFKLFTELNHHLASKHGCPICLKAYGPLSNLTNHLITCIENNS